MARNAVSIDGELYVPLSDYLALQQELEELKNRPVRGVDDLLVEPLDTHQLWRHVCFAREQIMRCYVPHHDGSGRMVYDRSRTDWARETLEKAMEEIRSYHEQRANTKGDQSS